MSRKKLGLFEFQDSLENDQIFRDYFNKFCCLPIFGQRVSYLAKKQKFLFDPPPSRIPRDRTRISKDNVFEWLYKNRYSLFCKSKVRGEFNLCSDIGKFVFDKNGMKTDSKILESLSDNEKEKSKLGHIGLKYLDDLKRKYLCKVSQMLKFTTYIESSTASDYTLIGFWMAVELMEFQEISERVTFLREIQKKYFMRGSQHCLPFSILDRIKLVETGEETQKIGYQETLQIKNQVFKRIVCYWLIKYLAQCKYMKVEDRYKLRQIAAIDTLDDVGRMIRQALMQSQFVRVIPDPEAHLRGSGRESKWVSMYKDHEEEAESVLTKKEVVQDEWLDEPKKIKTQVSQMLGTEDVDYIHENIFGKEMSVSFTALDKQDEEEEFDLLLEHEILTKGFPVKEQKRLTSAKISTEPSSHSCYSEIESRASVDSRVLYADGYEADLSEPHTDQSRVISDEQLWRPVQSQINQSDEQSTMFHDLERVLIQIHEETTATEDASEIQQIDSSDGNKSQVNFEKGDSPPTAEGSSARSLNVTNNVTTTGVATTSQIHSRPSSNTPAPVVVNTAPVATQQIKPQSASPAQLKTQRSKSAVIQRSDAFLSLEPSIRKSRSVITNQKEKLKKTQPRSRRRSAKPYVPNTKNRSQSAASYASKSIVDNKRDENRLDQKHENLPLIASTISPIPSRTSTTLSSLLLSAPISTNPSQTSVIKRLETKKQDYLKGTKPYMKVWDILSSDAVASQPFREYLESQQTAKMEDNCHGDTGVQESVDFHRLICALDLWKEIELLRTTFTLLSTAEVVDQVNSLMKTFGEVETSLKSLFDEVDFNFDLISNISNDLEFPVSLIQLQRHLENILKEKWVLFAIFEQRKFLEQAVICDKTILQRNSFPSHRNESNVFPDLRGPHIPNVTDRHIDNLQIFAQSGNLGTLGPSDEGHMRYRTARAYRLLLWTTRGNIKDDFRYNEFIGDESSDEEGGMPPIPIRVRPILPKLDPKVIAQYIVKEYPRAGIDYSLYNKVVRAPKPIKRDLKPLFLRPIRKNGVVMTRPLERPKKLQDVLKDPLQFEFFKRYMKLHKSEAPLLFCKSVELLKRTEKPAGRRKKGQQVLKNFFGRLAGGGVMLQCNAEIIKELANVETATTSMLVEASNEVVKSLDKNWAQRYFNTFELPEVKSVVVEPEERLGLEAFKTKLAHIWKVFSEFMRKAARFIKSMRDAKKFQEFYKYLESLPNRPSSELKADASSTALLFRKNETVMYKHLNTDIYLNHTKKDVNGKSITLNFLPNDLVFWAEATRYVSMMDNLHNMIRFGCYVEQDFLDVKEKSEFIMGCFLNSSVPPRTRVNVDTEVEDAITKNIFSGKIGRGLFHEAVLAIFPLLIHFWKKFRHEKFAYVSKKKIRKQHTEDVRERKKSLVKKYRRQLKKKLQMPASQMSNETCEPGRSKNSPVFPDYVNDLPKKKQPYDIVKGLLHSEPPTLHFSLEHGLKLILPPRRKKAMGVAEIDDPDLFMDVWTRGAKIVNVLRQGSDPKLFNLDDRKKGFSAKCDISD